jgi:hypothetical protein
LSVRTALILIALIACGRSDKPPAADQSPVDQLGEQTLEYMEQMPAVLLSFDGDCDAYADRLLTLEPRVKSIRAISAEHPDAEVQVKGYLKLHKTDVLAKLDAAVKALGTTREAVEAKEADAKAKCGDNARVQDAMDRVGVFKKK